MGYQAASTATTLAIAIVSALGTGLLIMGVRRFAPFVLNSNSGEESDEADMEKGTDKKKNVLFADEIWWEVPGDYEDEVRREESMWSEFFFLFLASALRHFLWWRDYSLTAFETAKGRGASCQHAKHAVGFATSLCNAKGARERSKTSTRRISLLARRRRLTHSRRKNLFNRHHYRKPTHSRTLSSLRP